MPPSNPIPHVASVLLELRVDVLAPALWRATDDDPPALVDALAIDPTPPPGVVSLSIQPPQIRTTGFTFPQAASALAAADDSLATSTRAGDASPAAAVRRKSTGKRPATRIQPPSDLVKLEDRLYYLLQPPLESLLDAESLSFPFEPFPYQLDGIAFLYPRSSAVLADEMGLGKTMQAITTIRMLLHAGEVRRVLLVCPKPLVTNWQREFQLWAPEAPVDVVAGDKTRRRFQWSHPSAVVTLANYELLLRDRDVLATHDVGFDLVVLDESQRIKNRASATSQAVRSIRRGRSWALTGTPVENSAEDLVGIFEFVSPGYLRSGMKPRAVGRAASGYVLRRTKDRVLTELPPKLFRDAELDLTPEQRETYRRAEDEGVVQLSHLGGELTIQHVFELVLRLKQICNFDPATGASAKLERLYVDLEECARSGRKAIVFSQWVQTLTELRRRLADFGPLEYHGKIPSRKRDGVIEQFRNDPDASVLLMSYGAGSVGLNLQFASYVFLFDRWWNPAVEDQAINRAHRIGATGPVTVSRFVSSATIEQRIDQILAEKRELFDTIFSGNLPERNLGLSRDEIFGLFKLQTPARREAA
jgi:SNF2 family DNA or RNA helicase